MHLLLAFLTTATAAELPTETELQERYPGKLSLVAERWKADLLTVDARQVPLVDALAILGREDDARKAQSARRLRNGVSWAMWGSALGALALTTTVSDDGSASDATVGGLLLGGLVLAGGGTAVRLAQPRRHVGAWMDPADLREAVASHNAAVQEATVAAAAEGKAAPRATADLGPLHLDAGRVTRADGRRVDMASFAASIDDTAALTAYWERRRASKVKWAVIGGTSGGVAAVGAGVTLVSIADYFLRTDGTAEATDTIAFIGVGGAATALGMVGAGVGIGGGIISRSWQKDPRYWYEDDELEQHVGGSAADVRGAPLLHVQPVVGPGVLGLAGTF